MSKLSSFKNSDASGNAQVSEARIIDDLATPKFEWDHPFSLTATAKPDNVTVVDNAASACHQAHAVVVLTEWEEFKVLDYRALYEVSPHACAKMNGLIVTVDVQQLSAKCRFAAGHKRGQARSCKAALSMVQCRT